MPILAVIAALAVALWGMIVVSRVPLVLAAAVFLIVGYIFGADFWHARFGPLPLTLDRLIAVGLVAAVVVQWRRGRLAGRPLCGSDWLVAGLLLILTVSAATAGAPENVTGGTSAWGRLAMAFYLPAVLYGVARVAPLSQRWWKWLAAALTILGGYLAFTAVCEISGLWSLVFPRYIADPNLGIHFGRARGPALNSASLGMFLTACGCCAYSLLRQLHCRWQQLAITCVLPLFALGVLATFTRSTWLGLGASAFVIAAAELPRRWRLPALAASGLAGLLIVAATWSQILGLEREGTAAEAHHSVDQRASFAYVSWRMFTDHPVFGVGFGRFYDRKLPYLSDRSQAIELESIRPLHHHNTLLSLLTETGFVGLTVFIAVLVAWSRQALCLAKMERTVGVQGLLMLALLVNYFCSAVFHDLTLVPAQHWLLFLFAGLTVSMWQDSLRPATCSGNLLISTFQCRLPRARVTKAPGVPIDGHGSPVVELFGMRLSRVTMRDAVRQVLSWCAAGRENACRYVVTPNVDHAVLFQERGDLREAYGCASLVLADGAPIVLASRILGARRPHTGLPERVAGSDLVPQLFTATERPLSVFLLGAAPHVAERAAAQIQRTWPLVKVVGCYSPPFGFERDPAESAMILRQVAAARPDLLIVGLGAPKQELWVHQHHAQLQAKVALCVGATIDFLAGEKRRSPVWMRRAGLEWAHRVVSEPRRLARRYARDAWIFPRLLWREFVKG